MNEDQARAWLSERFPADCVSKLDRFVDLLRAEAVQQSLIARSTFEQIWARHIVDSAQLVPLAPSAGLWLDVGSGGGLPGIVIAILRDAPIVLSEPRRMRVEFLYEAIDELGLSNASVFPKKVQQFDRVANVVTARAVSAIRDLFTWTNLCVSRETQFLLQRGRTCAEDVALARRAWHGEFHVEQSITDPDAGILVAQNVRPR